MSPVEYLQGAGLSRKQYGLMLLLLVCALISTVVGMTNAMHQSQDFQWSAERVLLQHIDPWAEYLAGDPEHRFIMTQIPNYLPVLYVLILPLGFLPLVYAKLAWALANVMFAMVSAGACGRAFELGPWKTVGLVGLMMLATPTRISVGNGQQSLLLLMIWCLTLLPNRMSNPSAMLAGLAYFKYSFAPVMALFLLLRRGWRALLFSLVPAAAGVGMVWLWITGGRQPIEILRLVTEPFAVARLGFKQNAMDPNLMNLIGQAMRRQPEKLVNTVEIVSALAACSLLSYMSFRRNSAANTTWHMSLAAVMSYGLFKHHTYDAVVLLLPLAYAVGRSQEWAAKVLLGLISYLFFFERLLQAAQLYRAWFRIVDFLVLVSILAITYRMGCVSGRVRVLVVPRLPAQAPRLGEAVIAPA